MPAYKRNQVEEAIFRSLKAHGDRADEVKFRIKRLLVADRKAGRDVKADDEEERCYAFYSDEPPGSGTEVMFSAYEAFAQLAAIVLLEHGWPQAAVVRIMRQVRRRFEISHRETLRRDPKMLFDMDAARAKAQPGMIGAMNTHPVFLVIARLTGSSVDKKGGTAAAICEGHDAVMAFMRQRSVPWGGITYFEFAGLIHTFADHLSTTRPTKRGRGAD